VSVVWKEETVVFVRDRARVERTALGIAGGQSEVVEAVQDEASPTPLPGEPQKPFFSIDFSTILSPRTPLQGKFDPNKSIHVGVKFAGYIRILRWSKSQTITTRLNLAQLKRQTDDLSRLASLNAVFKS
jgi:hypothetical protein